MGYFNFLPTSVDEKITKTGETEAYRQVAMKVLISFGEWNYHYVKLGWLCCLHTLPDSSYCLPVFYTPPSCRLSIL